MDQYIGISNSKMIAKTAFWMAVFMFISKCLGFIREMVMAGCFGASYITDAYIMANAIPGIMFGGIFSAIATAYMPVFSKIKETNGGEKADLFTSEIINLLLIISVASGIFGIIFSKQIVSVFASGFTGETALLTNIFLKVSFMFVVFFSIAAVFESYLQYKGTFIPQIVAGFSQNIVIIVIIIISFLTSYYFLAIGFLLGNFARFMIMLIITKRKGFQYTIRLTYNNTINRIFVLALPVFIGSAMNQISTFVDKTLASGLREGSISALGYGMLLVTMVTGLTTGILTTIIYPKLAKANSLEAHVRFNNIISSGLSIIITIAIPFSFGAMLYSRQIVQIVYERGAFDPVATALTESAFFYYAIGLTFTAVNELLVKVYYSLHDMKTPMIFAGISVIIDIVLNFILIRFMAHNGLALSTSISFIAYSIMLISGLRKKYPDIKVVQSVKKVLCIIIASIISVGLSWAVYVFIINSLKDIICIRMIQLAIPVILAVIIYISFLNLFKVDEIKLIKQIIKK